MFYELDGLNRCDVPVCRWRNPYTQHMLLQYFEPTGLVTQLPDAYNYKPYWCANCTHCHATARAATDMLVSSNMTLSRTLWFPAVM